MVLQIEIIFIVYVVMFKRQFADTCVILVLVTLLLFSFIFLLQSLWYIRFCAQWTVIFFYLVCMCFVFFCLLLVLYLLFCWLFTDQCNLHTANMDAVLLHCDFFYKIYLCCSHYMYIYLPTYHLQWWNFCLLKTFTSGLFPCNKDSKAWSLKQE